jgi:hypothetical protein
VVIRLESLDAKRSSEPIILICNHTWILIKCIIVTDQPEKRVWGDRTPLERERGAKSLGRGARPPGLGSFKSSSRMTRRAPDGTDFNLTQGPFSTSSAPADVAPVDPLLSAFNSYANDLSSRC